MGCPNEVEIGDDLVFTVCTHVSTSGVRSDADAVPNYRLYEDTTGTPVVTGNMAKLDDDNTTGFYASTISCLTASGFENAKSYNILVTASVNAITACTAYSFKCSNKKAAIDKIEDIVGNKISVTDSSGATTIFADDSTTSLFTCTISDNSVTTTRTRLS